MPPQPPWTDIGNLQTEIHQIRNELRNKANGYEISSFNSRLDAVVSAVRDISSVCDGILSRLEALEARNRDH